LPSASLHSPARDTEATSSLAPGVNAGFRAQVASEAVVEAAKRRRRHDEAKVFDCPMCSYQLTTKQNLQCEWKFDLSWVLVCDILQIT